MTKKRIQKDRQTKNKRKNKRTRGLSVGSITFKVLVYLADLAFIPLQALETAAFHPRDFYGGGKLNPWAVSDFLMEKQLQRAVYQLKQREYLVPRKDGFLTLSPKAQREIVKYKLKNKKNNKWDGKFRIIIFDVIEARRDERDFLRDLLKELGCKQLQKSVWITPWDIENELREFIKLTRERLNGDIRFAVADKLSGKEEIVKYFNL